MVYAAFEINPGTFPAAKFGTFANLVNLILPIALLTGAMLLLIMLFTGGFTWITAGSDPERIKKAQKTITFAIIGLVIVILSYVIVKLIAFMFRIQAPL